MWNHIRVIRILKEKLPFGIKLIIIRVLVLSQYIYYNCINKNNNIQIDNNKKNIFVLLSTDYSNLGDHGMSYAHIKLLKEEFPDCNVIEILVSDTLKYIKSIKKVIKDGDIITLKGGGNIGLEYFREELYRRTIISTFTKNRIIIFPQTIYFPSTKKGKKEFNNTIKNFKNHPELYLFTRDKISFESINTKLENRVYLIPDTVLSLKELNIKEHREGVTLCLRSDTEGIYTHEQKKMIKRLGEKYFNKVVITDTIVEYEIKNCDREKELVKIWKTIAKAELIITDRLHGMIFAALTSTPCIVFGTYNHKLKGQYEWLKHLNYIRFIECNEKDIEKAIKDIKSTQVVPYDFEKYPREFKKITDLVRG